MAPCPTHPSVQGYCLLCRLDAVQKCPHGRQYCCGIGGCPDEFTFELDAKLAPYKVLCDLHDHLACKLKQQGLRLMSSANSRTLLVHIKIARDDRPESLSDQLESVVLDPVSKLELAKCTIEEEDDDFVIV